MTTGVWQATDDDDGGVLYDCFKQIVQHAMDCLEQIQSHDSMILQNVGLQMISPKLLNAVGSSNRLVSQRAVALLYRVYRGMASTQAATYLSHVIEHEKDKLRIAAIRVATEMASNLADDFDYLHSVIKRYFTIPLISPMPHFPFVDNRCFPSVLSV